MNKSALSYNSEQLL